MPSRFALWWVAEYLYGNNALIIFLPTQYAVDKSKVAPAGITASEWRERTVAQLNAAMTQWVDSLPDHRTKIPSVTSFPL